MKRNILVFVFLVLLSLLVTYPLGKIFNDLFFHQSGGGFDVGLDEVTVNLIIGILIIPAFLTPLLYGIWGIGNWRWLVATVLTLLIFPFLSWAGSYLWFSVISFISGVIFAQIINFLRGRMRNREVTQSL